MSKTKLTKQLESAIFDATNKMGVFGCFEVSMGFGADLKERVDYMTYDTKGIFRCYELKITKSDFHSKNHNTFCGHYNYYVMPKELAEEVVGEIPQGVGVYIYKAVTDDIGVCECWIHAAKQDVTKKEVEKLKDYFIRSLSRDSERLNESKNARYVASLKKRITKYEADKKKEQKDELAFIKAREHWKNKYLAIMYYLIQKRDAGELVLGTDIDADQKKVYPRPHGNADAESWRRWYNTYSKELKKEADSTFAEILPWFDCAERED